LDTIDEDEVKDLLEVYLVGPTVKNHFVTATLIKLKDLLTRWTKLTMEDHGGDEAEKSNRNPRYK